MVSYLGIDLGGTSVKLGVCGASGRVRRGVARRVRQAWLAPVRIVCSSLGDDAGWIGAALWAAR